MNRFPFPPYRSGIPHWSERVVTYCAKVLPIVFDNSLSYYEFLGHMQVKLNQVIEALNSQNLVFVEFTHMIELELQNFEKYMDERQSNFEQSMQDEWTAFKADMEEAWDAFKTQMEEAWAAEQELNEQFRTDMQAAFTQFQTTIQQQQAAFETLMQQRQSTFETSLQAQQNQFQTDMVSRQNTFEDTMEDNFEDWKVDTLAALQAGIQQFETDALAAIRAELPDLIEDVVGEEIIEPVVKREVARNGFAKILSAANQTAGAALDLTSVPLSIYDGGVLRDDGLIVADLANVEIKPNTSIVFTSQLLWRNVGNIRALVSDAAFPSSGWTLQIGKYTTQQAIGSTFDVSNFTELVSSALSDSSTAYYANSNAGIDAGIGYYQYVCIRFVADPSESSFTCNYSAGIELDEPQTADLVVQSELNGNKYLIPKQVAPVVDQTFDSTSANAQSGVAVQQALQTIPSVTVDQTFDGTSANAQSGVAVQQAIDERVYTVTFRQSPVATYISSQVFTNPYGNQGYIYTMAFHVRQTAPAGIPAGKYIGVTNNGVIGFSIENDMLYAHCVVTDYGTNNVTVGSTTTLSAFTNIPCYKIG